MESGLTKLEMDAVCQLIQLSGSSDGDFGGGGVWINFPAEKDADEEEGAGSRSAGEALSSTSENCSDDEPLPRRNPKFGSLIQIYRRTRPIINNRARKRSRF